MEHTLDIQSDHKSVIFKNFQITDQLARTKWSVISKNESLINFADAN